MFFDRDRREMSGVYGECPIGLEMPQMRGYSVVQTLRPHNYGLRWTQ